MKPNVSMLLSLLALVICTICLIRAVGYRARHLSNEEIYSKERPFFRSVIAVLILAIVKIVIGKAILLIIPVIAVIALVTLRRFITVREIEYACALAVFAGTSGYAMGGISNITPVQYSLLQFFIALTSFLAGWCILKRYKLIDKDVGVSRFLRGGAFSAVRSFLVGALIGIPWALSNIAMNTANSDGWVRMWWQPFAALQPAIAEEAWGRILMVPLFFAVLRNSTNEVNERKAFGISQIIVAFWFAYLHCSGVFSLNTIISIGVLGFFFALPLSYLCFYRDLETAIGFHFIIDFTRYVHAFLSR